MKATFENTVDILVKAYLNDTLQHGNCTACAVGNIIAASCGFKFEKRIEKTNILKWVGHSVEEAKEWYYGYGTLKVLETDLTLKTGYSHIELGLIERAFESSLDIGIKPDERMFNGLMAVVEVLSEIHGIDLTQKEEAKKMFVKV